MKEDVPIPDRPPRKRRQMEQALDLWLATWAARDDLTPSERRRVEEEQRSRRVRVAARVVGFTGTREGMTPPQRAKVRELLEGATEGRHGDCVGSDVQFHDDCTHAHVPVVVHPPKDQKLRAFCHSERIEPPLPYLDRDKEIVKASSVLVAAPKESREPPPARGQGTWSTVRYARHRGVPRIVVMPDGQVLAERS